MKLPRGQAGFSLIEVMCALLILAVGLAGLVQGISTALGSNKDSELHTTAALLAEGRMETLRVYGASLSPMSAWNHRPGARRASSQLATSVDLPAPGGPAM